MGAGGRGFKSPFPDHVKSRVIVDTVNPQRLGDFSVEALVAACGVDFEVAEKLSGGCFDHANVEVCDVEHDAFSFVLSADHDVAEKCSVAECDAS